ncbi:MAG: hypothetical protein R3292_07800 [Alcanivorax sp.]|nr:hypothetical protein [Alcanivorax sp.]
MKILTVLCLLAGVAALTIQPQTGLSLAQHRANFDYPNGIVPAMPRSPDHHDNDTVQTPTFNAFDTINLNAREPAVQASITVSGLNIRWDAQPSI